MVPALYLYLALGGFALSLILGAVGIVWHVSRKAAGGLAAPVAPIQAPFQNTLVDPEVISMLSQRLAVLEGRLPAMQQMLDGYQAQAVRLGEIETRLPALR